MTTEATPTPAATPAPPSAVPAAAPIDGAAVEATPQEQPDPSRPPRHAELGKWAAERKAQRDQEAQREADARDAAAYRAMLAQGFTPAQAAREVQSQQPAKTPERLVDPRNFEALFGSFASPAEARAWLNEAARHVANPAVGALYRQVEEIKNAKPPEIEELKAKVEALQAQREAEQQAAVDRQFLEATEAQGDDGPRHPWLSRLPRSDRFGLARQVIADYREAGWDGDLSIDDIAAATEEYAARYFENLGLAPKPSDAPLAGMGSSSPSSPSAIKRSPPGPRSLSNDDMASPSSPRPTDPVELEKWVKARHAARRRSAG